MKSADPLFELVRSLSSNEKRYFKLRCNLQSGEKSYLKLFDWLVDQSEYNPEKIKLNWKDLKVKTPLFRSKNYLYKHILDYMCEYQNNQFQERQFRNELNEIEYLFHKKLFHQCGKKVEKALKQAKASNNDLVSLQLIAWANKINYLSPFEDSILKGENSGDKVASSLEKIKDFHDLQRILNQLKHLVKHGGVSKDEDVKKQIDLLISTPVFGKEETLDPYTRVIKYRCLEWHALGHLDYEQYLSYLLKARREFIKHPELFERDEIMYFNLFGNSIIVAAALKKYTLVEELLQMSKELSSLDSVTKFSIHYGVLLMYIGMKDYDKAVEFIENDSVQVKKDFDECPDYLKRSVRYLYVVVYHIYGKHDKALIALNEIINDDNFKSAPILFDLVNIQQVLIHYSLGNFRLAKSLIKNFRSKEVKLKAYTTLYRIVLNGINRLIDYQGNTAKEDQILLEMDNQLKEVFSDRSAFDDSYFYFDINDWIQKRISHSGND